MAFASIYFLLAPAIILIGDLSDPALANGDIPRFVFRWHHQLSPRFETWARQRVVSDSAVENIGDISGTEWPVFNAVFYLWTTEALQRAWLEDSGRVTQAPAQYASGAIEAAAALLSDPGHAAWVRQHWGDDYLEQENLFYRMLLISGLTSYQKLSGDNRYQELLAEQVETLSAELDASPYGLLDDYPGQCYPIDIIAAIAAIQRADVVLGTDHSAFVASAIRGFQGPRLDMATGLPAYVADSRTGQGLGPARGVGMFMLIWAPEIWPETARQWYSSYNSLFWQSNWFLAGFREYSKDLPVPGLLLDVDAGPIINGYGTAASAFGIGAARTNGHFAQAYALSAEALVASWPLPDGTRLSARLLSNLSDAPYIGETALLFNLTRQPLVDSVITDPVTLPGIVYLAMALYLGLGLLGLVYATSVIRRKT